MTSASSNIANVTLLPRQPIFSLTGAVGFETVNEVASLRNYLTLLRAVNPTRRMALAPPDAPDAIRRAIYGLNDGKNNSLLSVATDDLNQRRYGEASITPAAISRAMSSVGMGAASVPEALVPFLLVFGSATMGLAHSAILSSLTIEEKLLFAFSAGGDKKSVFAAISPAEGTDALTSLMGTGGMTPILWIRLFRTLNTNLYDVPVSMLLDALECKGKEYDFIADSVGTNNVAPSIISGSLGVMALPPTDNVFNGLSLAQAFTSLVLKNESSGNLAFDRFTHLAILLDMMHGYERLAAILGREDMNLTTKDPNDRFRVTQRIVRLAKFISLQPAVYYGHALLSLINDPLVKETLSRDVTSLYESPLFQAFSARLGGARLSHPLNHVLRDTASGSATTRFGAHPLLRAPMMVQRLFGDWAAWTRAASGLVATAADPTGHNVAKTNAIPDTTGAADLFAFMRTFLNITGTDENWASMINDFQSDLGYEPPATGRDADLLNVPVVMSDGWTASETVDYAKATRSLVITPQTFMAGGPEKVVLTGDARLALPEATAALGVETSASRVAVVRSDISPELRRILSEQGVAAFLKELDRSRGSSSTQPAPPLWVVRMSTDYSLYATELRTALSGRLPMTLFAGDLDAQIVPHTTFEDFAHDIGMSPLGLAGIIKGTAPVSPRITAFVKLFFTTPTKTRAGKSGAADAADIPAPTIFTKDASAYGLAADMQFAHQSYFISARSAAMQIASLVSLIPFTSSGLSIHTREFGAVLSRDTLTFRTLVAEPLQRAHHIHSLGSIVELDEEVARAWGTTLATKAVVA